MVQQQPVGATVCPKCASQLAPAQRFGVQVKLCSGCDSFFLDESGLNDLIAAHALSAAVDQLAMLTARAAAIGPYPWEGDGTGSHDVESDDDPIGDATT